MSEGDESRATFQPIGILPFEAGEISARCAVSLCRWTSPLQELSLFFCGNPQYSNRRFGNVECWNVKETASWEDNPWEPWISRKIHYDGPPAPAASSDDIQGKENFSSISGLQINSQGLRKRVAARNRQKRIDIILKWAIYCLEQYQMAAMACIWNQVRNIGRSSESGRNYLRRLEIKMAWKYYKNVTISQRKFSRFWIIVAQ